MTDTIHILLLATLVHFQPVFSNCISSSISNCKAFCQWLDDHVGTYLIPELFNETANGNTKLFVTPHTPIHAIYWPWRFIGVNLSPFGWFLSIQIHLLTCHLPRQWLALRICSLAYSHLPHRYWFAVNFFHRISRCKRFVSMKADSIKSSIKCHTSKNLQVIPSQPHKKMTRVCKGMSRNYRQLCEVKSFWQSWKYFQGFMQQTKVQHSSRWFDRNTKWIEFVAKSKNHKSN